MRYWVGVVGSRETVERLRVETETWWCAPEDAAPHNLIALDVARSKLKRLPENEGGVMAIFEIVGAASEREEDCRGFDGGLGGQILAAIKIELKQRLAVSLELVDMRLDPWLSLVTR